MVDQKDVSICTQILSGAVDRGVHHGKCQELSQYSYFVYRLLY